MMITRAIHHTNAVQRAVRAAEGWLALGAAQTAWEELAAVELSHQTYPPPFTNGRGFWSRSAEEAREAVRRRNTERNEFFTFARMNFCGRAIILTLKSTVKFMKTIILFASLFFMAFLNVASAQTGTGTMNDPYQITATAGQSYTFNPVDKLQGFHDQVSYTYYLNENQVYRGGYNGGGAATSVNYTINTVSQSNAGLYRIYEYAGDDGSFVNVYYNLTVTTVPAMPLWALIVLGGLLWEPLIKEVARALS